MRKYIYIISLYMALAGCSLQNSSTPSPLPDQAIPLAEMNEKIALHETPGMMDVYNETGLIFLDLENLSMEPISFPPDFGSKIYVKDHDEWLPIKNDFSYSGATIILPTEEQYPSGLSVSIWPILPEAFNSIVVRIVVTGKGVDTDETVGAYLDFVLK